jgi:hypothetical protein
MSPPWATVCGIKKKLALQKEKRKLLLDQFRGGGSYIILGIPNNPEDKCGKI